MMRPPWLGGLIVFDWTAPFGAHESAEPIIEFFGRIPRPDHTARVLIDALDEFRLIEPQQDRVESIDDLLHERAHFVIADALNLNALKP